MKKRTTFFFLLIFLFLGIILLTKPSYGQTYRTFSSDINYINRQAKWKFGPFRIYPLLLLRDIGYDSNVYYGSKGFDLVSDFSATISFRADVYFIFRNWLILTFSENPAYLYFAKQEGERYLNNSYSLSIKVLAFSRIALSGTSQFRKSKVLWSSEFYERTIEEVKEINGNIFYETARNTTLGFTGAIRDLKYGDATIPGEEIPISVSLNREERSARGEFYYRVFSDSFYFVNFGYVENSFDYAQSRFRDTYSYQLSSGLRFPLLGGVRGILSLGYKTLIPRTRALKGYSGIVGNTEANFRIGRFSYRLEYSRDVPFSTFRNTIFYKENRYGAGISFYLNRYIRLDYNFRRGENNYPEPQQISVPNRGYEEIKRKDVYKIHSGALVFRIIKNTGFGLRTDYWEIESNLRGADIHRFFVGGFLTYEF